MWLKRLLATSAAGVLAKSYYLTQLARLVVQRYDNDCNAHMYKNGEVRAINLILSKGHANGVFVDVGANKGDWSEAVVKCGGRGRLVLVDPLRRNLEVASQKLNALNFNNYQLCEYALSNKEETMQFFVNSDPQHSGTDSLHDMRKIGYEDALERIEVRCVTLDTLASQANIAAIDFLKVDVEGHELFVLEGAKALLSAERISFIQIEFGHAARAAGIYLHDIVRFVSQYRYKIYVIKPSGFLPLDFSPFSENRYSYINFLIVKNSALDELKGHVLTR